jgi:hypothetical protein
VHVGNPSVYKPNPIDEKTNANEYNSNKAFYD